MSALSLHSAVLRSEVEDLRILLHSADQQLSSLKKDTSLEINELGRQLASVESKVCEIFCCTAGLLRGVETAKRRSARKPLCGARPLFPAEQSLPMAKVLNRFWSDHNFQTNYE